MTMKPITLALVSIFCLCANLGAQTGLAPLPPDGFVTLETIVGDFSKSVTAALQKYNGMRICVYGRVGKITRDGGEEGVPLAVFMQLPTVQTPDVKAVFDPDYIASGGVLVANNETKATVFSTNWNGDVLQKNSFIVQGENIAVRGTFDNFIAGDIVLKNSFKLGPGELAKKLAEHGISND